MTRGYLGVEAQPIGQGLSKALGLNGTGGALVAGVQSDSPAAKAGLEPGDVIESVGGHQIKNPRELAVTVASLKPGEETKLDVVRNGEHRTVDVTLAQLPSNEQGTSGGPAFGEQQPNQPRLGLALGPISPELRDRLNVPEGTKGAVVMRVQPGSPADAASIRRGDVIVGVGTEGVANPEEAVKAIRGATREGDKTVALRILRNGKPAFVAVTPAKPSDQG